jgi:capsular exopolysaccharide synthesis family protein
MLISNLPGGNFTQFGADVGLGRADQESRSGAPALLRYWTILKKWKWVVAGTIAGCVVLGLVLTLLMTRQYTAITRVEINREKQQVTAGESLESADASRDLEFYQTQYALLESPSLAQRVSRRLKLATNERFFQAHGETPEDGDVFEGATGILTAGQRAEREKQVQDILLKYISIRPLRGSALIDVAYTSSSPDLSVQISDAWAQEFIATGMDRRFSSASAAREFLEGRLANLRTRLEQSERTLVNYAAREGIVTIVTGGTAGDPEVERTLVSSDLDALNQELAKAVAERVAAESRLRSGGLSFEALGNNAITALRQKRGEAAAEYARLSAQFDPGYPALDAVERQLQALDASIQREEGRVRATRTTVRSEEHGEALRRENELRARVEGLKRELEAQRRAGIQYNIYKRDVDTNRELYNGLLQRYKEIGVAGVGIANISIVDLARTPDVPSSPNLPLNLALALLAGLILSGGAVFALEQIDEGIKDPSDVAKVLQEPLLGGVPDTDEEVTVAALEDPKSVLSEAYISIWSNLAFSTDHGMPRTLAITSTRPAEGKSTSAIAIALAVARTGKRVVIVDGDMRSPSLNVLFGRENRRGLSNFLTGDDDWRSLLQKTGNANLSLLTAGPKPPSAAELLSSVRLGDLVQKLSAEFDTVIVDAPPVLGLADAPLLARHVEGCIYVAEVESAPIREIRASIARLKAVQANVLGIILTKLRERSAGYGYGYGYGYGDDIEGKSVSARNS